MKFFCEYCGNRIDAEKHTKCPHCGASYKKNKDFIKLEQEKQKEKELNNKYKNQIIDHVFNSMKISKYFLIFPLIIFIIIFIIVIYNFIFVHKNINSDLNQFESTHIEIPEEKEIKVELNEYATTTEYRVKATKYEVVEDKFNRAEEGYEYVKFYLIVENLTSDQIYKEDVNCIVDGIAQTNELASGYSTLPMFIRKELTVKGTSTFLVPKDATSYDIKYGDYITIHIEK